MADPSTRKNAQLSRLRNQLKKKREALADEFEFKMYILFHFKEKQKPCAMFESSDVIPIMTNNYSDTIIRGAEADAYSVESSKELIEKDIVQLHAPKWQSMRKDVIGYTTDVDFLLWPRRDVNRVECFLFSRWKGDDLQPYKPLEANFHFESADYEKQLLHMNGASNQSGLIITNPCQNVFLFVDRHHLQTNGKKATVFKLSSICLYLPQDKLMMWQSKTYDDILHNHLVD